MTAGTKAEPRGPDDAATRRCRTGLLVLALSLSGVTDAAADATTEAMARTFRAVCLGSRFDPAAAKTKLRSLGWRPIDPVLLDPNPKDSNTWVGTAGGIRLQVDVSRLTFFSCSVRGATSDFAGLKAHVAALGGRVVLDEEVGGIRMLSRELRHDGVAVSVGASVAEMSGSLIVTEAPR